MTRTQRMTALISAWQDCEQCAIGKFARHHVFFRGPLLETTRIALIGEGPGRKEDEEGEPFVGRSGELIDQAMAEAGFQSRDCVFTNLVCCRPADSAKGPNRPPENAEILNCAPRLYETLQIIAPRAVVLLGKVPSRAWNESRPLMGVSVYHLHHPAYLLRLGGKGTEAYQETVMMLTRIRKGVPAK